jgi:two-component system, NtrC family, response regulator AtoC
VAASVSRAFLIVTHRGQLRELAVAPQRSVTLGRGDECDLVLAGDSSVSRQHARFGVEEDRVWVEDLGSRNGTRIRTSPIPTEDESTSSLPIVDAGPAARHVVPPNAVIEIGGAMVTVHHPDDADDCAQEPIVADPKTRHLFRIVDKVADSTLNIILMGESGVGKEVFARAIHARSTRRTGPLVALNCGAVAATLLEAELFGYERGAFTGATQSKVGLLEAANGGTVLLDEVGELALSLQVKLLRVLEERAVTRIGATLTRPIDVRFISATNRDLVHDVEQGLFRLDLFHRLDGIRLVIPPLRERVSEIIPLARRFAALAAQANRVYPVPDLSPDATAALEGYDWPGNIRELRNAIERAVVVCGEVIEEADLGLPHTTRVPIAGAVGTPTELRARADAAESERIRAALEACAGNQTRAAEQLGLSRRALVRRLAKFDVPRPRRRG